MKKILNIYIKRPLLYDIAVSILFCYIFHLTTVKFKVVIAIDNELVKSIISDLINTSISLAGFVLASLTIIVTFKDNISNKSENNSGIGLLFSSKHYSRIVGVFVWAVFIFLIMFLILSISKLFIDKLPNQYHVYYCLIPICLITFTILRSLLVLYSIIKLQLQK
jgi:hypothetical protein